MKIKLLLSLCLVQLAFASAAFATADTGDAIENAELPAARITLTSDPEEVKVASLDKTAGTENCHVISGVASIYGLNHGSGDGARQPLAGGGHLDTSKLTAAMLPVYYVNNQKVTVPLHKVVEVTGNGHTIKVLVNDRGPYAKGRKIDLTPAAARGLGFSEKGAGIANVQIKICR